MPYDPIRDSMQSEKARRELPPPPPKRRRFDPVHAEDNLQPRPSSSSSSSDYSSFRDTSSPAIPALALPALALPKAYDPVHNNIETEDTVVSPTRKRVNMPPPPPAPAPYAPRARVSPASSILRPITADEVEHLRNASRNTLRRKQTTVAAGGYSPSRPSDLPNATLSRKRPRDADPSDDHDRLHPTLRNDAAIVASHYNSRPEVGRQKRHESPIIGLKSFNNWIKSVMIAKFAGPVIKETNDAVGPVDRGRGASRGAARVLDLGCGKGGDLIKWGKASTGMYVGVDIAAVSIEQAQNRWREMKRDKFDAEFMDLDCFSKPLSSKLPPRVLQEPFDAVSMQFCMHYAFETEEKVRTMLQNASHYLRPGGVMIGTIPNSAALLRRLKRVPENEELSFGNDVYRIRFESRKAPDEGTYGHKYWFYLKDAVDAPEFVVRWTPFVKLASEYGLELLFKEDFHTIYENERESPEFKPLLQVMKVVDAKGESSLDQDQWEAANIYVGFAFRKV